MKTRESDVAAAVREIAADMMTQFAEIAAAQTELITTSIPEARREGVPDLVLDSCSTNTPLVLGLLARGVPADAFTPSPDLNQLTRGLVQRGVSLTSVARGYRLATQVIVEMWTDAVAACISEVDLALDVVKVGTSYLMGWHDMMTDRIWDEYRSEDERLAQERSLSRLDAVRDVLINVELDNDSASRRLGYRLRGSHVGLVLRAAPGDGGGAALDAAVRELSAARCAPGVAVRADISTMWLWMPGESLNRGPLTVASPVLVTVGRSGNDLEGFRRTHREALDALRVAELADLNGPAVTRYDDVDIAALCSVVPERCRDFIRTELCGLARDDRITQRLRETLVAYFAANSNFRATAAVLGVHHNTVRYRLDQAEKELGRPADERRLALELALHLTETIGLRAD